MYTKRYQVDTGRRTFAGTALAVALLCVFLGGKSAATIEEARAVMQEFREAATAAQTNQEEVDAEAMQKQLLAVQEKLEQARIAFDEANAGESDDIDVLMDYAEALSRLGDLDLAGEVLEHAVEVAPDHAPAWLALGKNLGRSGPAEIARSLPALRKALALGLEPVVAADAHTALGGVFYNSGLYDFARKHYEKAVELDPKALGARLSLVALDVRDGKLLEASDALDKIGLVPPQLVAVLTNMLGNAIADFEVSRRSIPDEPEHHAAYAKLLIRANRVPTSLLPLERALALAPENYVYWNLMGSVSRVLGDVERAKRSYNRSLELNPEQPVTREALTALEQLPPPGEQPDVQGQAPGDAAQPSPVPTAPPTPQVSPPTTP